jgi:hypothetical protein
LINDLLGLCREQMRLTSIYASFLDTANGRFGKMLGAAGLCWLQARPNRNVRSLCGHASRMVDNMAGIDSADAKPKSEGWFLTLPVNNGPLEDNHLMC